MIEAVQKQKVEANKVREVVKADETVANEKAAATNEIKKDCESDLAVRKPASSLLTCYRMVRNAIGVLCHAFQKPCRGQIKLSFCNDPVV